jgi:hypothetical protein
VGRRVPKAVRREETLCRTHERTVHYVRGLSPGVIAAIVAVEHGPLEPGDVAYELLRWEALARRGEVYRPGSDPCGVPQCCGPGPRSALERAIRYLPRRAKPGLRRVVSQVDEVYLRRTLPDPLADPRAPWWERRRPAGWPRSARS